MRREHPKERLLENNACSVDREGPQTIEPNALQGGFDAATKAELIKRVTETVAKVTGLTGDVLPIYVLLHDVPPQSWGFNGNPLSFEQLQNPPAGVSPLSSPSCSLD